MFLLHFRTPFWVDFGFSSFFFLGNAFPQSSVLPPYAEDPRVWRGCTWDPGKILSHQGAADPQDPPPL